jgi:trk system potassium uptake protein TrkA
MLLREKHEVLLIEKDKSVYEQLEPRLQSSILHGDGCEVRVQAEAGFARADVVAAVTGDDEDNLVVCQMAKKTWGVERVIARVYSPERESLFKELGIDGVVSATEILFNLIEQEISAGTVVPLAALRRGKVEVVEAVLTSRSPAVGRKVRDLNLPPGSNIVWIVRGEEGLIASGDTELQANDLVVILAPVEHASELRNVL